MLRLILSTGKPLEGSAKKSLFLLAGFFERYILMFKELKKSRIRIEEHIIVCERSGFKSDSNYLSQ